MLGVGEVDVPRTPRDQIADIVQHAEPRSITIAGVATLRAGPMFEVATSKGDFRLGQLFRPGNPLGGVRPVLSGTGHGAVLLGQAFPAKKLPKTGADVIAYSRQ